MAAFSSDRSAYIRFSLILDGLGIPVVVSVVRGAPLFRRDHETTPGGLRMEGTSRRETVHEDESTDDEGRRAEDKRGSDLRSMSVHGR